MKILAAIAFIVGCASPGPGGPTGPTTGTGSATTPPPKTEPTPPPPSDPTPPPATDPKPTQSAPGIGEKCGPNDSCAPPAACVTFYGIAGPRGPAFKSCEVKCTKGDPKSCPAGRSCTTIADGPGTVCR